MTVTRSILAIILGAITVVSLQCNPRHAKGEMISFYKVPLVCGAAPSIGCGSRIKPLFIETQDQGAIRESWTNRQGTVIAFVWSKEEVNSLAESLFVKHDIEAEPILDSSEVHSLLDHFRQRGKWLKGMDVDQLSIEEAGVIARNLTEFARDGKLISSDECERIRRDFEEYFERELVIVRTYDELRSSQTQEKWRRDGYDIYKKHIGEERADSVSSFFFRSQGANEDPCCDDEGAATSLTSEITCPLCGRQKVEVLPTRYCVLRYTCESCKTVLTPKEGDCCVFCSYGTHKCPSKQYG